MSDIDDQLNDTLSEVERASVLTCERAEALIASRLSAPIREDVLLARHLGVCEGCRELARAAEGAAVGDVLLDLGGVPEDDLAALPEVAGDLYVRGHEIGRGGMGRIVRARDRRLGRAVAIKELLDERLALRFEREARLTARLQHPSIVGVLEAGRWEDGAPFYAMKYVAGRPLSEALADEATLAGRLAYLPNVIAAVDAIAYAHSERVVHRDLKPHNILIGPFGETVVVDWGLAKDLADPDDASPRHPYRDDSAELTRAGAGTPRYMPPEQARGEAPDERVDVYALGATLFHLLAGKAPDEPISMACPQAPPELIAIVVKAMDPERERRYPDAAGLADELKRFQTGQLVEAHRYTSRELARRFLGRHRVPVGIAALAMVALAGGAAVGVNRIVEARDGSLRAEAQMAVELARQETLAGDYEAARAKLARVPVRDAAADFLVAEVGRRAWQLASDRPFGVASSERVVFAAEGRLVALGGRTVRSSSEAGVSRLTLAAKLGVRTQLSPDGRLALVTPGDGVAYLASASSGQRVSELGPAGGEELTGYAFAGDRVLGWGSHAVIWDTGGKRLLAVRSEHRLRTATMTPDGRELAALDDAGQVFVWDAATGDPRARIQVGWTVPTGHAALAFSPDGSRLATHLGEDEDPPRSTVAVWDRASGARLGEQAATPPLPGDADLVWSREGDWLLTRNRHLESEAVVLDADGRLVARLPVEPSTRLVGFVAGLSRILTVTDRRATLWSPAGRRVETFVVPERPSAVAIDPSGEYAAFIAGERTRIYQLPVAVPGRHLVGGPPLAQAFSRRGEIGLVDRYGNVQIFAADGRLRFHSAPRVPWSGGSEGQTVATWLADGNFVVMNVDDGMAVVSSHRQDRRDYPGLAAWTRRQLFASERGIVVFGWDAHGARRLEIWHHDGGRRGVLPPGVLVDKVEMVTADGNLAFAEGADWLLWRLDLRRGRAVPMFSRWPEPGGERARLTFAADGSHLLREGPGGTELWATDRVRLLEVGAIDARHLARFPARLAEARIRDEGVTAPLFRPDGALFASEAKGGRLRFYAGTAKVADRVLPIGRRFTPLAWSPDGKRLLVATDWETRLIEL